MNDDYEAEASPVTKVARDLTEILELYAKLHDQAAATANHGLMPGGEAMAALGNVANLEAWSNMQQATERHEARVDGYKRAYTSAEDEDPEEAWSPFQLLEFWSEDWRRVHEAEYDMRPTIASEAGFLRWALSWAWDNEPRWDDFAKDVRSARVKLENILYAGQRVERTRVQCNNPACESPRNLIRLVGADGREDVWKCSGCKQRVNQDEFMRAQARMMLREEAQRFVPIHDAIGTLKAQGRGERTVRRWLAPTLRYVADGCSECHREWPPQEYPACPAMRHGEPCGGELKRKLKGDAEAVVGGYCDIGTRKTWVWWPDLWTRHLRNKMREKSA